MATVLSVIIIILHCSDAVEWHPDQTCSIHSKGHLRDWHHLL